MFQKTELERLRQCKELLVQQSDVNRLRLAAEWQRARLPETWMNEAASLARRHPVWTAVLAAGAGAMVINLIRKPGAITGLIGRLGNLASLAFAGWKMFKEKNSGA